MKPKPLLQLPRAAAVPAGRAEGAGGVKDSHAESILRKIFHRCDVSPPMEVVHGALVGKTRKLLIVDGSVELTEEEADYVDALFEEMPQ